MTLMRKKSFVFNFLRVIRLKLFTEWDRCENCGKWTRDLYSIPCVEAGMIVCKKCNEKDLK